MSDALISMIERYAKTKQDICDVVECYKEQEAVFRTLAVVQKDDLDEVTSGMQILPEAVRQFFIELDRIAGDGRIDERETLNLALCLRAAIGGCSLTFRHLEISKTLKSGALKENTVAGSEARTAKKVGEAGKVQDIIKSAVRKPDGKIKNVGHVKRLVAARLGKKDIDYKTFQGYVAVIDGIGRTDGTPSKL